MESLQFYEKICSDLRDQVLDILTTKFPEKNQDELEMDLYSIFKNCEMKQADVLKNLYSIEIDNCLKEELTS